MLDDFCNKALRIINVALTTLALGTPCCALPLSRGDRLNILMIEGEGFSGSYVVNLDGTLNIPYLQPLLVESLEPPQVEQVISQALLAARIFKPNVLQVSVQVVYWAPVQVSVAGELFQPGTVLINAASDAQASLAQQSTQISGNYPSDRYLTSALRSAGGVMPDANIKEVRLIRGNQEKIIDVSGVFTGEFFDDVPLISGDKIIVPKAENFQNELMRPSRITPPGIKVYMSNLTVPASSNSTSSINQDSSSFPYGSRLSQAVIAANCAGGTRSTNAHRRATLVRTNRMIGETKYLDRPVEELLRKSHNDVDNPFLMPYDGVICYDSRFTNIKDFLNTIGGWIAPFLLPFSIFK
ncbi:polysaccharide biosynthesis/export family protein [Calothrix anomala FACHB-343]|uniref:Polysaccharide biosynthesis/export family protein n=2 Tax=Calothrix TaxID=1186 RepID=A0ABR8AJ35_9CYAN|nr:polysaccharide biosynthesis/export family protein [Calothrix parietina FACHB-288]MBD2229046.1 polysaccharide biosynthesis/export family protein [Calothrix anomala FACHB-343]